MSIYFIIAQLLWAAGCDVLPRGLGSRRTESEHAILTTALPTSLSTPSIAEQVGDKAVGETPILHIMLRATKCCGSDSESTTIFLRRLATSVMLPAGCASDDVQCAPRNLFGLQSVIMAEPMTEADPAVKVSAQIV